MSDFDAIEYRFVSFRFFIAGFAILIALFLLVWIGGAKIDVTVNSEPFIMTFEITLDQNAKNVLFNLDTIPAQIVDETSDGYKEEYIIVSELRDENNNTLFVFKADDLKQLAVYKAAALLQGTGVEKQIFALHPRSWEIDVLHKDIASGIARISVSVQEEVIPIYDMVNLLDMIRFKNVDAAEEMLLGVPGIKWAAITIFPPFYFRLPAFDSRMKFFIHP